MCTTIVVGKHRSGTGHVLLAHSEELGRNAAHRVALSPRSGGEPTSPLPLHSGGELIRSSPCARHLGTRIFDKRHYPGEHTSGVNEHGVAVANNMALMRGIPEALAYDLVPGGVIWTEFMQVVLESARTAREGVELIGGLCSSHGLSCDSGTMLAVADPDEAWWIELARDGQWAAQRIEPDEVSVRANCYRIGALDPRDSARFLCSPSLQDHARQRGWHREGTFSFAEVYGDPDNQGDAYNLDRHAQLEARFSGLARVGTRDLMAALRDTYQGTPLFRARADGSPFRTGVRTIARMNTEASTIIELRPELGPDLGFLLWCSLSTSLTGTYVPFHLGLREVEPHFATAGGSYDPASAYWLFTELAKLADYGYARCIDTILDTWQAFEAETFRGLASLEAEASGQSPEDARVCLDRFDRQRARAAIETLQRLLPEVKTRVFFEAF
jgi:dipeptidase